MRGACLGYDLRKLIIISLVLSSLSTRLFSLHNPLGLLLLCTLIHHFYEWVAPLRCHLWTWWSVYARVWMHSHVLAVWPTMDWVHSLEEIQCSAWWSWTCLFWLGRTEVSPSESPGSRDMWQCSGRVGEVSPLVSRRWWHWMLSWNQYTGFWHRCLSGPDKWWLSANSWILHPLWRGWDDKQTDMGQCDAGRLAVMCGLTSRSKHFITIGVSEMGR